LDEKHSLDCRKGGGLAEVRNEGKGMENPIGVVRAEKNIGNFQTYFEHISSVPNNDDGYGLNMFGINYLFEVR
jgi:hypothetical protein